MLLNEIVKTLTRKQLLEGGNAIKSSSRIDQLNVKATLDEIYSQLLPALKLSKKDVAPLGSTGKKDPKKNGTEEGSSGDIDLGISLPVLMKKNGLKSEDEAFDLLTNVAKDYTESKPMKGLGIVSIAFPIENKDGEQENKYVQVDMMPVENIEYAKWSYYSPAFNESKYKALYYKEFYYAIARIMGTEVLEKGTDEEGKDVPSEWSRYFFDLGKGLMKGKQTRKGKKGLVKNPKTTEKELVTDDPSKIVTMMFGNRFKPEDVMTWEDCWKAVHSKGFKFADKLDEILKIVANGIKKKGYKLPPELDSYK